MNGDFGDSQTDGVRVLTCDANGSWRRWSSCPRTRQRIDCRPGRCGRSRFRNTCRTVGAIPPDFAAPPCGLFETHMYTCRDVSWCRLMWNAWVMAQLVPQLAFADIWLTRRFMPRDHSSRKLKLKAAFNWRSRKPTSPQLATCAVLIFTLADGE